MMERNDRLAKHVMEYLKWAQWEFKNKDPQAMPRMPPLYVRVVKE
jgi:hypothetical protein